jgi:hypothetical protein
MGTTLSLQSKKNDRLPDTWVLLKGNKFITINGEAVLILGFDSGKLSYYIFLVQRRNKKKRLL